MQRLTRREALYAIGAGMFSAARLSAQEASLEFDLVDHVEFYVSQVERTRDFFATVFGNTLLKNASAAKSYVKIGSAYLAFERPRTAGGPLTTDHVSVAIRNIEMARVHAFLDSHGIVYRDYPSGRDTAIVDGDGVRTQLSPALGAKVEPPELPGAPSFRDPDGMLLQVSTVS
jgi:catechol 2,3-dioxygenase-like lactoylglutathione lyase family enzyme